MTFRVGIIGLGIMGRRMLSNMLAHEAFEVVAVFDPKRTTPDLPYTESAESLIADTIVDLVYIACPPSYHPDYAMCAAQSGKPVFCEKPLGVTLDEVEGLMADVKATGLKLQVGHMKRFDPGLQSAKDFIDTEMGAMLAFKGWYCDSTHRYPMTDAVQPLIVKSDGQRRPDTDPKADLEQYYMLAHGCHLVDTARFLCGEITEVRARHLQKFGAHSWFVDVGFASGAPGLR